MQVEQSKTRVYLYCYIQQHNILESILSLFFLFFSCKEPEVPEDMRTVVTDRGSYSVSYQPTPDPIPLSQEFALDITIKDIEAIKYLKISV